MSKPIAEVKPTWYLAKTTAPFEYLGPFEGHAHALAFQFHYALKGGYAVVRLSKPPTSKTISTDEFEQHLAIPPGSWEGLLT